jgi:flagellar hook-associated protein 1 FlgK
MADLLSTGLSGLRAFQRALETTSHNISNATTPGYSRQRVEIGTRPAQMYGNGWIGQGAAVQTTRRMYDDYIAMQTRNTAGTLQRLDVFASNTERLNNMFGDANNGLTATLQKFVNAFHNVANSPSSIPARQTLLSEADTLQTRLRYFESRLADMDAEVNFRLQSDVTDINALAQSLAKLNQDISSAYARGKGQPPNDLLDQRDRILDELSGKVSITTVEEPNGALNVFIGNGQTLVLGAVANELTTIQDDFDSTRLGIGLRTSGGVVDITRNMSGGSIGGMLDFRREQLDPARNELGRVSVALAQIVNEQHQSGMDLTGAMGQPLFAVGEVEALASRLNVGTGSLTVTRGDASALTKRDYILELTTGGWQMRYADTGMPVTMTGDGTSANPFVVDGMQIEVNPGAQVGDEFLLRPTRNAIVEMQVLIDDPSQIAAASPIRTSAGAGNLGTAAISAGSVADRSDGALLTPVTIEFTDNSTFTIDGDGPFTYVPGQPITYNGWTVEITGAPEAGDTFTVGPNTNGSGDNRNALLLADALQRPILNNGTTSLSAGVGAMVSSIGVATRQAQANRDAQATVYQESLAAQDAVAGVSLDEEAANLLKYQQAYQAAAQLIRIADTLFQTLLSAAGRA